MVATDYDHLKRYVQDQFGMDLSAYKDNQIKRRLETHLARNNVSTYKDYVQAIKGDHEEKVKLLRALTVNTTEFYRDPAVFDFLKDKLIPELLTSRRRIRIWSAGSSDGSEAYTLAMILDHLQISPQRFEIQASDIDMEILEKAKEGAYMEQRLTKLPPGWKEKYFTKIERTFKVSEEIKNQVIFKKHDLLGRLIPGPWDIILCRNVLIYLTKEAQEDLIARFAQALSLDSYLILGWPEYIFNPEKLGLARVGPCTYKKVSQGGEVNAQGNI